MPFSLPQRYTLLSFMFAKVLQTLHLLWFCKNLLLSINLTQKDMNAATVEAIINDCHYIGSSYQFYLSFF